MQHIYINTFFFILGLPVSLTELHLDGNKISKIDADSLSELPNLAKYDFLIYIYIY